MSYHYSMVIQWSQEDQLFLVHLPEFPWQEIKNILIYIKKED